jgi:hypothetical protein
VFDAITNDNMDMINDLVYVRYNLRLHQRYKNLKKNKIELVLLIKCLKKLNFMFQDIPWKKL